MLSIKASMDFEKYLYKISQLWSFFFKKISPKDKQFFVTVSDFLWIFSPDSCCIAQKLYKVYRKNLHKKFKFQEIEKSIFSHLNYIEILYGEENSEQL